MNQSWEDDIIRKNAERVLSLAYQVTNTNEFEKAIVDDLSYSEDFRIEKTGKEVKEKLQSEVTTIAADKIAMVAKMEALVGEIKTLPSGKADHWQMRGFEKYIGEVPCQYSYAQIYPNKNDQDNSECVKSDGMYVETNYPSNFPGGITPVDPKVITDKMREYNQVANDYICRCVEAIKLKTVMDNLADSKKIKLNAQLAAQLGF
jgi:hypothetical protein